MDKKIKLQEGSIVINGITIEDANTYKTLNDIKEDKREDFVKKAVIIGTMGLRNLYLTENVDYIEKEFKQLMHGLEDQSRELVKNLEGQSKEIRETIEKSLDVDSNSSSLGKMRVLFEDYFDKKELKNWRFAKPI